MASKKMFRKISLDRLSSPEQLDQKLTIVSPIGWIAWITLAILIVTSIIWGFNGSISKKVSGGGVILIGDGIKQVTASTGGLVSYISVEEGEHIESGQTLVTVKQDEMVQQINKLKEDLSYLKQLDVENANIDYSKFNYNIYTEFINLTSQITTARSNLSMQNTEYNKNISSRDLSISQQQLGIEQLKEQLTIAKNDLNNYKSYVDKMYKAAEGNQEATLGLPSKEYDSNIVSKESAITSLEQQIEQENSKLKQIRTESDSYYLSSYKQINEQINSATEQLKELKALKIQNLNEQILEGQEKLLQATTVVADKSGIVQEVYASKGVYIQQGGAICSIAEDGIKSTIQQVVVYVPVDEGKKVKIGMDVNISPTTVNKEEYGYIIAKVVSVSEYPISQESMMRKIGNTGIVQSLSGQGAQLEVVVQLIRNNETVSGYKWSTPKGAPFVIDPGTLCSAEVKVSSQRPIEMIVPFIKKMLATDE